MCDTDTCDTCLWLLTGALVGQRSHKLIVMAMGVLVELKVAMTPMVMRLVTGNDKLTHDERKRKHNCSRVTFSR